MMNDSLQRISVLGGGFRPTGGVAAPAEIRAVAVAPFRPELVEPRFSVFPRTPYDRGLAALGNIDAGVAAAKGGCAAVFLNTFGDYGIAELRSALSIPIVGAGEAAMMTAAMLGRRFAIVTVWPASMNFIYDERIQSCDMTSRCVAIRNVLDDAAIVATERGDSDDPVSAMRSGASSMIDRIVADAERAIAIDRADVIILGCTCMAPIGRAVAARLPVPVVEPMTTGYKMAETLLSLGLTHSAAAFPRAAPERLAIIDRLISRAPPRVEDEACEVCVIAAEA